ncbi:MAG: arsenate reductase family protein [Bacteroidia bacterium]
MSKKVYYLSTCDTCKRIISELKLEKKGFTFQDIKTEKITAGQLEEMKKMNGSYESLFSRVALKYKTLNPKPSTEAEYKKLILQEYTFLKRPVIISDDKIFVGNSKSNIEAAKKAL